MKERTTNPFLGTFLLVWIAHNWKVVYAFFYIDKSLTLEKRINYFSDYWATKNFTWNLIVVAGLTILILIVIYLFLSATRLITGYFQNVVVPFVHQTSKGKIVTMEIHSQVLMKVQLLEQKIEVERKDRYAAIEEREKLEKELQELKSNESYSPGVQNFRSSDVDAAVRKIIKEGDQEEFDVVIKEIIEGNPISPDNELVKKLLHMNIITRKRKLNDITSLFTLTSFGEQVRKSYFLYGHQ